VRWYFRFQLSLRDIEELLFERIESELAAATKRATKEFHAVPSRPAA
jgi:transposase-like protein